ncbi:GLPGLI family protein [Gilvibacter sediminis]|uniref:GLPGLI family protein n=1 Tax=Gilvibacter sediminis TaxID=379071 RepID=UPI0023500C07|nr:GLPGLI family protein [Gilvibacter sediminis]MDC7998706.1 GLPGLI family protein [Gilvibacter sediminis]
MKTLVYLSVAFSLIVGSLHAQDFQGIATYKTQRKLEIQLDSTQVPSEMQDQLMAMMKKQFEKEYTLDFNKDASLYKVVEALDAPAVGGGGMQIVVAGAGDADVLYKNIAENRLANKSDIFGKTFLIKDSLPQLEWTLTKETKNIGQYTCFKATRTEKRTVQTSISSDTEEGKDNKSEAVEEEITITAWYTPQIPLGHGPGRHHGLPGLILEISDGDQSILCSKIVMNPKDGVQVSEPTKGKEVTQDEYNTIMQEKMKEMQERYQPSNGRRDGNSFEIRIGG